MYKFTFKKFDLLIVLGFMLTVPNMVIAANVYGPIKTGEILWNVAAKVRPVPSLSRYQVMLALLRNNPHAFDIPCNLNTLKTGQILYVPPITTIQALSRTKAIREFRRQQKEWKTHRRQKRTIICPLATTINRPIVTKIEPLVVTSVSDIPIIKPQKQLPPIEKPILPSSSWNEVLSQFLAPMSLSPMVGFLIIIILLLLWFMNRKLRKYAAQHVSTPIQFEAISQVNKLNEASQNPPSGATNATIGDSQNSLYREMKEKLDNAKVFLAGNEAQTTQRILQEVIQKGSPDQKNEAKQLYEIKKRMDFLKQFDRKSYSLANDSTWQKDKYMQTQQHLPENQDKVFELVDNFFELLDDELNAQGKLFEAYLKRQQVPPTKSYEIFDKEEQLVNDENEFMRPELKPTRVL